ncbi:retropepsin-like aspartic protease [Microbulbifer yueqingensis]|uniref:Aspartyl protease n=1 Tax=Microbulbifer yueqingensis TaxID=658219 RepID=A0A1G9BF71_9GAMM|nr:retropepsin-like aspartic protease [Microbulbifer yueqingensis]SDK38196.1 Aspartyl protease [Microbulbifer yueqingensis]
MKPLACIFTAILLSPFISHASYAAEFTVFNNRVFLPAYINGTETLALLDSGAEMSLIDKGYARSQSLVPEGEAVARGTGGQQAVQFVSDVELQVDGALLKSQTLVAIDLADVSQRLIGRPLTLVIGRSLFDRGPVWIDFASNELQVLPAQDQAEDIWVQKLRDAEKLPLRDHKGIKQIPVLLEGHEVLADFDLGNGSETLVSRTLASELGLVSDERIAGTKSGGGVGGEVTRQLIRVKSLTIGNRTFHDLTVAIDDTEESLSMNIGMQLLKNFSMLVDFPADTVHLVRERVGTN